jgi:hypothetical protein
VRHTYEYVGSNISWFIPNGVLRASDTKTERKLRMKQVLTLFKKPVQLLLCDELGKDKELTVTIKKGTTEKVLEKMYSAYKPMFKEMGNELVFEGLSKIRKRVKKGSMSYL